MQAAATRALLRRSNGKVGPAAARASVRKAQGMVRDATVKDGVLTDGMVLASRATEGPAKLATATDGMLTDGPALARRSRRVLAVARRVARSIHRQTTDRNSVQRIAPASLMGYKALPFCAATVGRWANRPSNPIRTSRPRPGDIHG